MRGRPKNDLYDYRRDEITPTEAARLLKLPESSFFLLVQKGIIPKTGGKEHEYVLGVVLDEYLDYLFDSKGLKEAQTQLMRVRAKKEQKELDAMDGELVPLSVVMKIYAENISNVRSHLLALPTKLSPELEGKDRIAIQAKLKHEIYEMLKELADYDRDRVEREAALLRRGK